MHYLAAMIVPDTFGHDLTITSTNWTPRTKANDETLDEFLERVLDHWNEQREVEPYQSQTPEQAEAQYQRALEYHKEQGNDLSGLPKIDVLNKHWDSGYEINANGEVIQMSTWNPDGEWDWYQIGGRWSDYYTRFAGESAQVFADRVEAQNKALGGEPRQEIEVPEDQWYMPGIVIAPVEGEGYRWITTEQWVYDRGTQKGEFVNPYGDAQGFNREVTSVLRKITAGKVIYIDFHA